MSLYPKEIVENWYFKSLSSTNIYEVIHYSNGVYSCNCPAWTRKVSADGSRTCKHLREVIKFKGNPPSQITPEYNQKVKETKFPHILLSKEIIKKVLEAEENAVAYTKSKTFNQKKGKEIKSQEPKPPPDEPNPYERSFNL